MPGKCVDCLQKTVKHSYHIRCGPCVEKSGKCAKCGDKEEQFVNIPEPHQGQLAKEEADFQRDLKCLPERRRRAFLRYLCSEEGMMADAEEKKIKLKNLLDKFGKDDFGLDDLDGDFDDLDLEDNDSENECSSEGDND